MKITVNYDLCEANAVCMKILPSVFRVGEDDRLVLLNENPPESLRDRVEEAVRRCPKQALSIRP